MEALEPYHEAATKERMPKFPLMDCNFQPASQSCLEARRHFSTAARSPTGDDRAQILISPQSLDEMKLQSFPGSQLEPFCI